MISPTQAEVYTFPCSFAQQRLWIVNQLAPNNPFYNIHAAVKIPNRLDPMLLRKALNALVQRHEPLRTTFTLMNDDPMQVVAPTLELDLTFADLSHLPKAKQRNETLRRAELEVKTPFDLARGPLLRLQLLYCGVADSVLLLTIHHIIADAWSMGVLFREVSELYTAFATGRPPQLPDLSIQYADFAVWQREWLSGEALNEQMSYWRTQLSHAPIVELPTDFTRPPIASYRGASHPFALSKTLSDAIIALSQRESATPFMLLLATFAILLQRYSRQDDLVIGVPIANRNRPELEGLIGFFVNSLVMRIDTSGDPSFCTLLGRVRAIALGAYAHQDLPFEKLVEELQPERDLSRNPLFQISFQVLNTPVGALTSANNEVILEVQRGAANFDLSIDLWQSAQGFQARVDYASDLFEHATIVRMMKHFVRLLEHAVDSPQQPISTLSLLDKEEAALLRSVWSGVTTNYPRTATVHALFAEQAAATPSAIALTFERQHLSYAELNRRANRLAHYLIAFGVAQGEAVGLCYDRSIDMIVALLAILKAGGAYVALDPSYPAARLEFMVQDAGLQLVIGAPEYADYMALSGVRYLTSAEVDPFAAVERDPPDHCTATSMAYIAYTSGSTGEPKGVCVLHRGVTRLVRNSNYASFCPDDKFLHFAPLAFDASTLEIWGALLNGAELVIFPPISPSLAQLATFLTEQAISVLWLTAGLFNQMAELHTDALAKVRQLFAGGDVLSPAAVRAVLAQPGAQRLINGYGPTEGTTFTCCHVMGEAQTVVGRVPIGKPIANTRVYVLDPFGQLAPIGVPGELYIGGDGVALGYLNRDELTKARFVPDPFDPSACARLYRTGDLVRWRADGVLDFLGRLDRQVKVRGFRVELGEIEVALENHPAVRACVATTSPDRSGDKHLSAYLVPSDPTVSVNELRQYLVGLLPGYLIPSEIVLVEKLPLNANGKVDLAALPLIESQNGEEQDDGIEGEVEALVREIWCDVLGNSTVGAQDNFFTDLHGHSLLATRVISRLRTVLALDISLRTIFEHPTLRAFALAVEDLLIGEIEATPSGSIVQAVR